MLTPFDTEYAPIYSEGKLYGYQCLLSKVQETPPPKCCCGCNLQTSKTYRVRVRLPNGTWRSKQVNSLEMAKKVNAKFKTQAIEEEVFNIHQAPSIEEVSHMGNS